MRARHVLKRSRNLHIGWQDKRLRNMLYMHLEITLPSSHKFLYGAFGTWVCMISKPSWDVRRSAGEKPLRVDYKDLSISQRLTVVNCFKLAENAEFMYKVSAFNESSFFAYTSPKATFAPRPTLKTPDSLEFHKTSFWQQASCHTLDTQQQNNPKGARLTKRRRPGASQNMTCRHLAASRWAINEPHRPRPGLDWLNPNPFTDLRSIWDLVGFYPWLRLHEPVFLAATLRADVTRASGWQTKVSYRTDSNFNRQS